jgi:hypothetical protein
MSTSQLRNRKAKNDDTDGNPTANDVVTQKLEVKTVDVKAIDSLGAESSGETSPLSRFKSTF